MWFLFKGDLPNYDLPKIFDGFIYQLVVNLVTITDMEEEENTDSENAETSDEAKPIMIDSDSECDLLFCNN